jgi:hypothetical protein
MTLTQQRIAILHLLMANYQQQLAKSSFTQASLVLHNRMNEVEKEIQELSEADDQ